MKPRTEIDDPFADLFEETDDSVLLEESIYDEVENHYGDDLVGLVGGAFDNDDTDF